MSSLTLNKITSQKGIPIGEAVKKIADLGWTPTFVQEAMTHPTDYVLPKAPRDPMKQVLRSYFPMQEEKDNRVSTGLLMRHCVETCLPMWSRAGLNG